jgi:hypothetical protein
MDQVATGELDPLFCMVVVVANWWPLDAACVVVVGFIARMWEGVSAIRLPAKSSQNFVK